ncbi:MAG: hypothetical protein ABI591_13305 [Kofleriaceae bacterium]
MRMDCDALREPEAIAELEEELRIAEAVDGPKHRDVAIELDPQDHRFDTSADEACCEIGASQARAPDRAHQPRRTSHDEVTHNSRTSR